MFTSLIHIWLIVLHPTLQVQHVFSYFPFFQRELLWWLAVFHENHMYAHCTFISNPTHPYILCIILYIPFFQRKLLWWLAAECDRGRAEKLQLLFQRLVLQVKPNSNDELVSKAKINFWGAITKCTFTVQKQSKAMVGHDATIGSTITEFTFTFMNYHSFTFRNDADVFGVRNNCTFTGFTFTFMNYHGLTFTLRCQ